MTSTHPREPDPSEFDAIVQHGGLGDLAALDTDPQPPPPVEPTTAPPGEGARQEQTAPDAATPAASEPVEPDVPPAPNPPSEGHHEVRFPLRKAKDVGFAMSTLLAALGQILFFRELFIGWFGHPVLSTVGAVGIAACFEVGMIGSGDEAMRQRARDVDSWKLLLGTSGFVATVAVTVQTLHWLPNAGLAITFGFASMVGWVIHMVTGWVRANSYRQAVKQYDADKAERDAYLRAIRERKLADWQTAHQAARRAAEQTEQTDPAPAAPEAAPSSASASAKSDSKKPAKESGNKKPTKQAEKSTGPPTLTPELAREWSDANGGVPAPTVVTHFKQQGYQVRDPRTVRRWLNDR